MRAITDDEWKDLQAKYPAPDYELVKLDLGDRLGTIVLRNPSDKEYGVHLAQRLSEEQKKAAFPNLLTLVCVFPPPPELAAGVKRWPGLPNNPQVLGALRYLSGEADALAGKG